MARRGGRLGGRNDIPNEHVAPLLPAKRAEEKFRKEGPPTFNGLGDPMEAEKWVRAVERIFEYIGCSDREKLASI